MTGPKWDLGQEEVLWSHILLKLGSTHKKIYHDCPPKYSYLQPTNGEKQLTPGLGKAESS